MKQTTTPHQAAAEPVRVNFERIRSLVFSQPATASSHLSSNAACRQYRCLLGIKQFHPSRLLTPPAAALQLWQAHARDTRNYRNDCVGLFRLALSHRPRLGLYAPLEQRLQQARSACRELLLRLYGPDSLRT